MTDKVRHGFAEHLIENCNSRASKLAGGEMELRTGSQAKGCPQMRRSNPAKKTSLGMLFAAVSANPE